MHYCLRSFLPHLLASPYVSERASSCLRAHFGALGAGRLDGIPKLFLKLPLLALASVVTSVKPCYEIIGICRNRILYSTYICA